MREPERGTCRLLNFDTIESEVLDSESPLPDDVEGAEVDATPAGLPPKLYKIGEVIQYSGLSRQTIHNYTMLGLISEETRTPSGHRLYGEAVFYRLKRIQELKKRMSLKEVRQMLESGEG